jgi:uncharacterized lipoprotein YbaY
MRVSFLAFALLLASCSTAPAPAPAPAPVRLLDRATQIAMVPTGGYAFSHDGRALIFSANDGSATKAYSISVDGGLPAALTDTADTRAISYFPNDDRVLLQVGNRLAVRERDSTTHDLGAGNFMGWCADGSLLMGSPLMLARVDGANYERRTLISLPPTRTPALAVAAASRDCRWAALVGGANQSLLLADVSAADAPYREIVQATPGRTFDVLGFTPTNRSLNYAQRQGAGFQEAYRYQISDGQTYVVMQTQADVLGIAFSPTGRYAAYYSGANGHITDAAIVDQTSDQAVPVSSATRDLRFNRDDTKIAFRLANDGWPADIFVSDLDGGHITRLVHAPNAH